MEHKLIPLWPLCDTLAFSLLIWPIFASLPQRPWGIPIYFTESVKTVIYVAVILYIHFSVMHPGLPAKQPGETKAHPHRRYGAQHTHSSNTRRRVPPLWMMVIRVYLKVYQFFQFKEPKRRSFVRFDSDGQVDCSTSVVAPAAAPTKTSLHSSSFTLLKTLVSGKSFSSAIQPKEFYPQIQFVLPTAVGFKFPHPSQVQLFVCGLCWSQHHIDEQQSLVVVYGLRPSSSYEIELKFPLNVSSNAYSHENSSSSSADQSNSNIHTLVFPIVTRNEDNTVVKPRKVKCDSIVEESLDLVNSALADERAIMRRNRREATRQQTNLKREIAEFHAKMPAKLKADDRIRKRIKTLQERLNQKRLEVDSMAAAVNVQQHQQNQQQQQQHQVQQKQQQQQHQQHLGDSFSRPTSPPTPADSLGTSKYSHVADLAHNVEIRRKEREVQQEELEASLQKWNEREEAKRRELTKLQKRNEKQSERVAKVASSIVRQRAQGVDAVMECISALKQERLERKENRLAIEAELISSTQSLR